jgi:MYXO-CTERM domain-containing protein
LYSDGIEIYASTGSNGLFVSPVAASTYSWSSFNGTANTALPSLEVRALHASGSTLYAATRAGIATFSAPTDAGGGSGGGTTTTPPVSGSTAGGGAFDPLTGLIVLVAAFALRRRS